MVFVLIQSPTQLAVELQSKPLSSEIRELLKLLAKPNLKVRLSCTCKVCSAWMCASASLGRVFVCFNKYYLRMYAVFIRNTCDEETHLMLSINFYAVTCTYKMNH